MKAKCYGYVPKERKKKRNQRKYMQGINSKKCCIFFFVPNFSLPPPIFRLFQSKDKDLSLRNKTIYCRNIIHIASIFFQVFPTGRTVF